MAYSDWKQIDFSDDNELYYIACTHYNKKWSEAIKEKLKELGEKCKHSLKKESSQSITHKEFYEYIDKNDLLKDFPKKD